MTSNIEFTYNGKVYQKVEEFVPDDCGGCVFEYDSDGCDSALRKINCSGHVWKEKIEHNKPGTDALTGQLRITCNKPEPEVLRWTLDEIQQAYEDWDMYDGFSVLSRILRKQKQGQDPEYQKYLEMKAKFGD